MKINQHTSIRRNPSIQHQPPEERQAALNQGRYKLKAWQRALQQHIGAHPAINKHRLPEDKQGLLQHGNHKSDDLQKIIQPQLAVRSEISRAYTPGRSFAEYSMPGKLLFAMALLSTLTAAKATVTAPPATSDLCSKEKIFELFGIDGTQKQEPIDFRLYPEPGSMAAELNDYIDSKTPKPNNPIIEQLLADNFLTYPVNLDIKYRVAGHSPGQIHTKRQPCPVEAAITPAQQHKLAQQTYHAIQQAAEEISAHTQFNLHEENTDLATDVTLHIDTCNAMGVAQGIAESPIRLLTEVLQDDELVAPSDSQDTNPERVANIIQAYRTRCHQMMITLSPAHSQVDDPHALKALVTHELGHALGLVDTYLYPQFTPYHPNNYLIREQTIMSYINTVPASKSFHETFSSSEPQSLMPYDVAALDLVANYIRQQQAEHDGTSIMPNPLWLKSPHRGDTKYHFTPGSNTIEVIDRRDDQTSYAYILHPTAAGEVKRTLIDSKGYDTWDFRQYRSDLKIDIRPNGATIFNHSALTSSSMESAIRYGRRAATITQLTTAKGNVYLPASDDPNYLPERVFAGDGNDEIHGNALDNVFHPGNGQDVITGGKGKDDYVFQHGSGNTLTITDFDTKHNRLVLHPSAGIRNFHQLQRHVYKKANGDLEIHLAEESKIILNKMAGKALRPKNFLRHPQYHQLK